jgi:geranylgeranylglycerol-phosphate geranylgeranyltransferase
MHNLYRTISGFILLTRPANLLICFLSVWLGAVLAGFSGFNIGLFLACSSATLIMAGGNVINDYYDVAIDKINKPFRPIPVGLVTHSGALKWANILFALGLFLSIFVTKIAFLLAVSTVALLFCYGAALKRTILLGNVVISVLTALVFVYGALAFGRARDVIIPAVFAFLFHFGREIIKDIEDSEADAQSGFKTFPIRFGTRWTLILISFIFLGLIIMTPIPWLLDLYNQKYLWTVFFGVDLVLLTVLAAIWARPSKGVFRAGSAVLKADMLVGLFAIYIGRGV